MARPVTPRPPSEHVKTLTRMVRQIEKSDKMSKPRRRKLLELLPAAVEVLKREAATE